MKIIKFHYKILDIVYKNFEYLKQHPKHLAWCMLNYDLADLAARYSGYDTDNPKYPILDGDWPKLTQDEKDLWYQSWCVAIPDDYIIDDVTDNSVKLNMTFDDWHTLMGGNRLSICNTLFFVNGSGLEWSKDGYIMRGSEGIDEALFYGFTLCEAEIPEKIRKSIQKITSDQRINVEFDKRYQRVIAFNNLDRNAKNIELRRMRDEAFEKNNPSLVKLIAELEEYKKDPKFKEAAEKIQAEKITPEQEKRKEADSKGLVFYPFSEDFNNLSSMPDNAHPSYIKEGIIVAQIIADGKAFTYGDRCGVDPCTKEMIRISKKFLDKWKKRGY